MRKIVMALTGFAISIGANAQEFPTKALRIVVPNPPGGTVDIVARAVGQRLQANLGQAVIVDPRPGGNSIIGSEMVARAAPDGHTILMATTAVVTNPLLHKLPYAANAFVPVALLASTPNVIAVHPSVPAHSLEELIALAKARPNALNYAGGQQAGSIHMAAERFKALAGIDMNFVPYQGGVQAVLAAVGGHVDIAFAPLSDAVPHLGAQALDGCLRRPGGHDRSEPLHRLESRESGFGERRNVLQQLAALG